MKAARPIGAASFAFALVLMFGLAACGGDSGGRSDVKETANGISGSFVGQVEDTEAYIAVVVGEDRSVMAYICDGKGLSQWFKGTASSHSLSISSGAAQLTADLGKEGLSGNLRLTDGRMLAFSAKPAKGQGGLYRAEKEFLVANEPPRASYDSAYVDSVVVGGWIVLNDGSQRGQTVANPKSSGLSLSTNLSTPVLQPRSSNVAVVFWSTTRQLDVRKIGSDGGVSGISCTGAGC